MMPRRRLKRRYAGLIAKRSAEAGFDQIEDQRGAQGKTWKLAVLLQTAVVGVAAGCTSLAEVESLTDSLSPAMRSRLGMFRRLPDTTLRDALCTLTPESLRPALHRIVRGAMRRKSLEPDGLPFGVAAMDGKGFSLPSCDDMYAQRQTQTEDSPLTGVVRSVTITLTSSLARPIIDVISIPAATNEMGCFESALDTLMDAYSRSDLFRLISYDAGACSIHNAACVRKYGLHYLFGLKGSQSALFAEAQRVLGHLTADRADAETNDVVDRQRSVRRRVFLAPATDIAAPDGWDHLQTIVRVQSETLDQQGRHVSGEDRYFICSLPKSRLTPEQWLLIVRRHWGVETSHQVLDVSFFEDAKPWITANPRGAAVVAVLRRIAYTVLTLFRSVSQRSARGRETPWKLLLRGIELTLLVADASDLVGLRQHSAPALT